MTVREMINELNGFDDDMQVVIRGCNSGGYVDWTHNQYNDGIQKRKLRAHFGSDSEVVVIFGEDQAGMI